MEVGGTGSVRGFVCPTRGRSPRSPGEWPGRQVWIRTKPTGPGGRVGGRDANCGADPVAEEPKGMGPERVERGTHVRAGTCASRVYPTSPPFPCLKRCGVKHVPPVDTGTTSWNGHPCPSRTPPTPVHPR